ARGIREGEGEGVALLGYGDHGEAADQGEGDHLDDALVYLRLVEVDQGNGELYREGLQDLFLRYHPHADEDMAQLPSLFLLEVQGLGELLPGDIRHGNQKLA